MAYDPTPLYETNKRPAQFDGPRTYKTAASPSPILCWFEKESQKRREGKYNEIDKNEIEAVLLGVKNKWFEIVQPRKKFVNEFLEAISGKNKDYAKAKQMWAELKELEKEYTNGAFTTDELPTRAQIQPEIPRTNEPGVQGAVFNASGYEGGASALRSRDGLLEARSACSYFEEIGLAGSERGFES